MGGRLATLEAEVAGLEGRVGVLKTEVGAASSGSATEVSAALLERGAEEKSGSLFADYAKLLASKTTVDSLKATTEELESKVATLLSNIEMLENQVAGNAFSAPSMLAMDAKTRSQAEGSSLE